MENKTEFLTNLYNFFNPKPIEIQPTSQHWTDKNYSSPVPPHRMHLIFSLALFLIGKLTRGLARMAMASPHRLDLTNSAFMRRRRSSALLPSQQPRLFTFIQTPLSWLLRLYVPIIVVDYRAGDATNKNEKPQNWQLTAKPEVKPSDPKA